MTRKPETRPRVALVAHAIHHGGGMERALAEMIVRLGDRVEFVVLSQELSEDLQGAVEWHRIRVPTRPIPLKLLAFCILASWELARVRSDLIHTTGAIILNRVDATTVHFCHAGFRQATGRLSPRGGPLLRRVNTALERSLALALERWCYRRSRLNVLAAVSEGVVSELTRHYPGIPLAVTPNGVDADRFQPDEEARRQERSTARVGSGDIVALFVGGDWDRKGLSVAIEGLAQACGAGATGLRLWVVGRGDQARFLQLAQRLGIADRVRFVGFRRDTERLYQAADLFLLPSLYEAMPLVVYEAAVSRLPLVCTPCNGIQELVGRNDAGIVISRTPEAVAHALGLLVADSSLREAMGVVARERALAYTWKRSATSVLDLYKDLLSERPWADATS